MVQASGSIAISNFCNIMKCVASLCLLIATLALTEAARLYRDSTYTTKYDNVNLDEILASDRLLQNYINCLMETSKCTPDGAELKRALPDALHTECSKCSEKQKVGAEKVIKHLIDHKPEQWRLLEEKYDRNGVYRKKYEAAEKRLHNGR